MRVLAAAWHPGSINAITPVINKLKSRNEKVAVVGYKETSSVFKRYGIFPDIILDNMRPETIMDLLSKRNPSSILTGLAVPDAQHPFCLEQEITLAAKQSGVKSVGVLDFWANYIERVSKTDPSSRQIFKKFAYLPDIVCVMDEFAKNEMLEQGFPESHLLVTGNPYFLHVKNRAENLDVKENPHQVLFCSEPIALHYGHSLGFDEKSILYSVFKVLSLIGRNRNAHYNLVVRKHPREKPVDISGLESNFVSVICDNDSDLHAQIMSSRVAVSPFSTVLIEARILGKYAISAQIGRKENAPEYLITNKLGITSLATSEVKLLHLINLAIDGNLKQKEMHVPNDCIDKVISLLS